VEREWSLGIELNICHRIVEAIEKGKNILNVMVKYAELKEALENTNLNKVPTSDTVLR
jgi:acyl-CoA thioesterase